MKTLFMVLILGFASAAMAQEIPALTCTGIWAARAASMKADLAISSPAQKPINVNITLENGVELAGTANYSRGAYAYLVRTASGAVTVEGTLRLRTQDAATHAHAYSLQLTGSSDTTGLFVCDPQN